MAELVWPMKLINEFTEVPTTGPRTQDPANIAVDHRVMQAND